MIAKSLLRRGPDIIRGQGLTFIQTKYKDPDGRDLFVQPGVVNHADMTNSPEMLQALFGPNWQKVAEEIVSKTPTYKYEGGRYIQNGATESYDYHRLRALAKPTTLFGRAGVLEDQPVVMLWGAPEQWESRVLDVIHRLNLGPNTTVTIGEDQYSAKDLWQKQKVNFDAPRLDRLAKYHTAIGTEKTRLAKELGLHVHYPVRPGSAEDWRRSGQLAGEPYLHRYGEFRDFLDGSH